MPDESMEIERTPDGRHIIVNGRRWRATDPSIPEPFRQQLVDELMSARREVGAGGRTGDAERVASARARVHGAKVALGERGEPWWEPVSPDGFADRAAATTLALLRQRSASASICPSDVARAIGGEAWRDRMPAVRAVAARLAEEGRLTVTQRDDEVDPATATGPIRLRRGPTFDV